MESSVKQQQAGRIVIAVVLLHAPKLLMTGRGELPKRCKGFDDNGSSSKSDAIASVLLKILRKIDYAVTVHCYEIQFFSSSRF
jgi:hypothetical protein